MGLVKAASVHIRVLIAANVLAQDHEF